MPETIPFDLEPRVIAVEVDIEEEPGDTMLANGEPMLANGELMTATEP